MISASTQDTGPVWIGAVRAAQILGVNRKTVLNMAKADRLPGSRFRKARNWRFKADEIRRIADEGRNGAERRW